MSYSISNLVMRPLPSIPDRQIGHCSLFTWGRSGNRCQFWGSIYATARSSK
jgi:hypothetical protein